MAKRASLLVFLALVPMLAGQEIPPPEPPDEYRLRVRVELVTTPLVVYDRGGDYVYDLRRDEVTVLDNGVPQQIANFEVASQPLSLVLLVNTSQRVAPLLERVRSSGILFTSYILGQTGEAALLTFDDEIVLRQDFTPVPDEFMHALERVTASGNTGTRLGDALEQAVDLLVERPEGRRRVVIAITEPRDKGSTTPIGVPLRRAQLLEVSVYTIALDPLEAQIRRPQQDMPVARSPFPPGVMATPGAPGQVQTPTTQAQYEYARADLDNAVLFLVSSLRNTMGKDVLEVYSHGTGGLHYKPMTRGGLEESLSQIGQDLHNQYSISYRPSNRDEQGFHRIEVRVSRPGVRLRARPGYYVGLPPS